MKRALEDIGGFVIFYIVIIGGILLLNMRFEQLNNIKKAETYYNYVR